MPTARPPFIEDLGRASGFGALISAALGYPVWLAGLMLGHEGALATVHWLGGIGVLGSLALMLGFVAVWCASALYGDGIDGTDLAKWFATKAAAASVAATPLVVGSGWGFLTLLA